MTHREFLTWLQPRLDSAVKTGLDAEAVRELREVLSRMRDGGALQPFTSKLHNLVLAQPTLDANTVGELSRQVRTELAPPREKTMVFSAVPGNDDD